MFGRFIHIIVHSYDSLSLIAIPLYTYTTIYLLILLLMGIWEVSSWGYCNWCYT